jgi:cytochrome oxidase Cu insertion factor (SCO1/SenC/PrrC family)/ABC-type Zn2+ transport system substrate-binding protein/surface adhesin
MNRPADCRWPLLVLLLSMTAALQAADDFRVLVSIKPMHSIVSALMQDTAGPELLIAGEQSPLDYELTPEQRTRARTADLLIWVGPELEAGLAKSLKELQGPVQVLELLANPNLKILPSRSAGQLRDAYFWLDNRNVSILVDDLCLLLQRMDPQRAHVYARNRRVLQQRLGQIDREYEFGYRGFMDGMALAYQDSLRYFEQAYALKVLDWATPSPHRPVDSARLLGLRQHVINGDARCLLLETGLPAPHLDLLTEGLDIRLGWLDSLGSRLQPGPSLYFELMEKNTRAIKDCLRGHPQQTASQDRPPQAQADSGRFFLTDHRGRLISDEDMLGKYQLLYFGYTFCPDICPTSLAVMTRALALLGGKAEQIQPYFISIDPQRDTVEVLQRYVGYFDNRLIGLTGSQQMIDRLTRRLKVKYARVAEADRAPNGYLMDHSASIYLLDPQGRFVSKYVHGIGPQQLHDALLTRIP